MNRIFIVGYMGAGKTTVGKMLAETLKLELIDLDDYIQNKYRKTIPQLFKEKGEEGFRLIEKQALLEVSHFENVVISTGGGTPCFYDNMEIMNRSGITIYLHANPKSLANRLITSKTVRPLIEGKSKKELILFIAEHLSYREVFYKSSHIVYHTEQITNKEDIHLTVNALVKLLINDFNFLNNI